MKKFIKFSYTLQNLIGEGEVLDENMHLVSKISDIFRIYTLQIIKGYHRRKVTYVDAFSHLDYKFFAEGEWPIFLYPLLLFD